MMEKIALQKKRVTRGNEKELVTLYNSAETGTSNVCTCDKCTCDKCSC